MIVVVSVAAAIVLAAWQGHRQYVDEPLHATIEAVGGCIALGMAALLLARWLDDGPAHFMWIATALLAMGLLDLAHGCTGPGPAFFWSRTIPTLVGGAFMALVWLAPSNASRALRWVRPPLIAVMAVLPVCFLLVLAPMYWPNPFREDGAYRWWAKVLNVVGGVGFTASAVFFLRRSRVVGPLDADLVFANHCVLFAVAAYLFGLSYIWGPVWWLFHAMRLLAYIVVLKYSVDAYRQALEAREAARHLAFERRLVGVVSHDLRNPVGAIALTTAHLLKSRDLPEKAMRALHRISNVADRMSRMLSDLLDFSRSRAAGALAIRREHMNLASLVETVRDEFAASHPGAQIVVEPSGNCEGSWDHDRMHQLLVNLVENAIKHGDKARPVRIRVAGRIDAVSVEVYNEGPAIPSTLLPRIFEPFQGSHAETSRHSFGLGLHIVREIVRAHGGQISVESAAGEGTRFRVVLPRHGPADAPHADDLRPRPSP